MDVVTRLIHIETAKQEIAALRDEVYEHYSALVNEILTGNLRDTVMIKEVKSGLVDWCEEMRFEKLNARLSQYIYRNHKELVGKYDALYRAHFEEPNSN